MNEQDGSVCGMIRVARSTSSAVNLPQDLKGETRRDEPSHKKAGNQAFVAGKELRNVELTHVEEQPSQRQQERSQWKQHLGAAEAEACTPNNVIQDHSLFFLRPGCTWPLRFTVVLL